MQPRSKDNTTVAYLEEGKATSIHSLDKHMNASAPAVPAFPNMSNKLSLISAQQAALLMFQIRKALTAVHEDDKVWRSALERKSL